jgi:hypothetical protein
LLIVDRIENEIVIIETETRHIQIPLSEFDGNVREGDIIIEKSGRYSVDKKATEERRNYMAQKLSKMWER